MYKTRCHHTCLPTRTALANVNIGNMEELMLQYMSGFFFCTCSEFTNFILCSIFYASPTRWTVTKYKRGTKVTDRGCTRKQPFCCAAAAAGRKGTDKETHWAGQGNTTKAGMSKLSVWEGWQRLPVFWCTAGETKMQHTLNEQKIVVYYTWHKNCHYSANFVCCDCFCCCYCWQFLECEMWNCHNGAAEDSGVLLCYTTADWYGVTDVSTRRNIPED
jgi:hypothetical protein